MLSLLAKYPWLATVAGVALLGLLAPAARADDELLVVSWPFKKKCEAPPLLCPLPEPARDEKMLPPTVPPKKEDAPKKEDLPKKEDAPAAAPTTPPTTDLAAAAPETGPALGEGVSLASSNVGYIDNAIPFTGLRFRADAAYRNNHPNRAEYFYGKYQSIGGPGVPGVETNVDYQDLRLGGEYAFDRRYSAFFELPYRFLNPDLNNNASGFSDINFGGKAALIAENTRFVTLQVRTYAPTGPAQRGLGTSHVSIEPGLLWWERVSERLLVEGEFKNWIPVNGSNYAGDVLQYGLGASYAVFQNNRVRISPVAEFVGWTVLGGQDADFVIGTTAVGVAAGPGPGPGGGGVVGTVGPVGTFNDSARGDTIINAKIGLRIDAGDRISIYTGYGRALTGEVWYKDLARVEVRLAF